MANKHNDMPTIREFYADWLVRKGKAATHEYYRQAADLFLRRIGGLADQPIAKLTCQHIRESRP